MWHIYIILLLFIYIYIWVIDMAIITGDLFFPPKAHFNLKMFHMEIFSLKTFGTWSAMHWKYKIVPSKLDCISKQCSCANCLPQNLSLKMSKMIIDLTKFTRIIGGLWWIFWMKFWWKSFTMLAKLEGGKECYLLNQIPSPFTLIWFF